MLVPDDGRHFKSRFDRLADEVVERPVGLAGGG
jgi:hypothetical protein